jgi:hypothetical protein
MSLSIDKGLFHDKRCFQIRARKKTKATLDALHCRGACMGPLLLAATHSHVLCITSLSLGSYLIT